MKPSVLFNLNRAKIGEIIRRYPVTNPRIFGSVLHGTDKENSDLDVLVDANPEATLLDLGGLQDELQTLLGIDVDLLTSEELPEKFRHKVLLEAKPI